MAPYDDWNALEEEEEELQDASVSGPQCIIDGTFNESDSARRIRCLIQRGT